MKTYVRGKNFEKVTNHLYCDYTGEEIDDCNDTKMVYGCYELNYHGSDPCFGSEGIEFEFGEKYGIDVFQFLYDEYHFICGMQREDHYAELNMMKEAIANLHNSKSPWYRQFSFDFMCRTARILTATRLIENKIIEPSWLAGFEENS